MTPLEAVAEAIRTTTRRRMGESRAETQARAALAAIAAAGYQIVDATNPAPELRAEIERLKAALVAANSLIDWAIEKGAIWNRDEDVEAVRSAIGWVHQRPTRPLME